MCERKTTYKARIRFHCEPGTKFNIDAPSYPFGSGFTLKTPDDSPIRDSKWLVIELGGIPSEAEARERGQRAKSALVWAGLCCKRGVDVGEDALTTSFGEQVRENVFKKTGIRIRGSVHGLDIFDESVPTSFPVIRAIGTVTSCIKPFIAYFEDAFQQEVRTDDRQEVACAVYFAAQYQSSARAKLLMLVTAVEVLAEPEDLGGRADRLRKLLMWMTRVGAWIFAVPREEWKSIHGSLERVRRVTIRQSYKQLIERYLTNREFDSRSAFKFFDNAYRIRCTLTHSGGSNVSEAEVQRVNQILDQFVSDLIQAHIKQNGA